MPWFHTFRYHPILAPLGRRFTDEAEFLALSDEWVDTPTKFPAPDAPDAEDVPMEFGTVRRVPDPARKAPRSRFAESVRARIAATQDPS